MLYVDQQFYYLSTQLLLFTVIVRTASPVFEDLMLYTIRAMERHIACTIRSAKNEAEVKNLWQPLTTELHWNRCPDDGTTHLYSSTLGGWLMAIPQTTPNGDPYHQDERPQGCIISYEFSNSTGWISFFVVTASYRGHGLGRELFRQCMDRFHRLGTQYIGIDSVPDQLKTYGRRGFIETNLIAICSRPDAHNIPPIQTALRIGESIVSLDSLSTDELIKSDLAHCGLERSRLWTNEALFHRRDAAGFAVFDPSGTIKGWVLIRGCESGYRIGPVYADRKELATFLLHSAMCSVADKGASLEAEVWHSNKDAIPVFEELGWKWTGIFHRMWYNKKIPAAQAPGGKAEKEVFSIFDAAQG